MSARPCFMMCMLDRGVCAAVSVRPHPPPYAPHPPRPIIQTGLVQCHKQEDVLWNR